MPSRRDLPPTPAELLTWLAVPEPLSASGVFTYEATEGAITLLSVGDRPVLVGVPASQPVAFAHQAPDRWRLQVGGELLAVSDGTTSVGFALRYEAAAEELMVGGRLQIIDGPDLLLRPDPPALPNNAGQGHHDPRAKREQMAVGDVAADVLIGRDCWRWSSPYGTWWLDALSGVLLRVDTPHWSVRFLELDLQPVAADTFAIPADLLARAVPVPDPFEDWHPDQDAGGREPEFAASAGPAGGAASDATGDTDFTVCWWPGSVNATQLVRGDPDVPEALVELDTDGRGTRFWFGVAPAGRTAPALDPEDDDVQVHRWDGDGWTFALSWQETVSHEDLQHLVASTPRSWP